VIAAVRRVGEACRRFGTSARTCRTCARRPVAAQPLAPTRTPRGHRLNAGPSAPVLAAWRSSVIRLVSHEARNPQFTLKDHCDVLPLLLGSGLLV